MPAAHDRRRVVRKFRVPSPKAPANPSAALAAHVVARAAAQQAAQTAFAAHAVRASTRGGAKGVKGGLGRDLYLRNAAGTYVTDPVSLNRIPVARAVRIGKQYWNSKTLRELLAANPRATNPLTRQPLPPAIVKKYGGPAAVQWTVPAALEQAMRLGIRVARLGPHPTPAQLRSVERRFEDDGILFEVTYGDIMAALSPKAYGRKLGPNGHYLLDVSRKIPSSTHIYFHNRTIAIVEYDQDTGRLFVRKFSQAPQEMTTLVQQTAARVGLPVKEPNFPIFP